MRAAPLHGGKADAPPPDHYVHHKVEPGETLAEIAQRYQTNVPMLTAANPQVRDPDQIEVGQRINVPIGAGYGREPTRDVVEPGQTLTELAREHPGVSPQDIAGANRHDVPNADRVRAGQSLWVPDRKPATPLEQKVQDTDRAIAEADRAQEAYDTLPTDANRTVRDEVHGTLERARTGVTTSVRAELDERVRTTVAPGTKPTEADYTAAGAKIKDRYQTDPAATRQLDATLTQLKEERFKATPEGQARTIVDQARGAGDAPKQVEALAAKLKDATPEVRQAVWNSAEGQRLLQDAANWATQPLAGGDPKRAMGDIGGGQLAPTSRTSERLLQLTEHLSPEYAARITQLAMPTINKYAENYQRDYSHQVFGPSGVTNMMKVLDRGAGTAEGTANLKALAKIGMWDRGALMTHVMEGGSPAYLLELAKQPGMDGNYIRQMAYDGVASFRGQIKTTAEEYSKHMSELGWLVQNHGGSMTPAQLEAAIADYTRSKGPEWEAKGKELQERLASQGATLQQQLAALGSLPPGTPGRAEAVADALNDPNAALALKMAWDKRPELLEGDAGRGLMDTLADPTVRGSARLSEAGRKVIAQLGTSYVQQQIKAFQGFDPSNPASVDRLNRAMARMESPAFARLLGVKPADLTTAIGEMRKLTPQPGDTLDVVEQRLKTFNNFLQSDGGLGTNSGLRLRDPVTGKLGLFEGSDGLKAFDKSTMAGQILRGAGVALAGLGLAGSTAVAVQDQSPDRIAKVLVDAAGFANKVTELRIGMGAVDDSGAARLIGGKLAGRVLGVVSAGFDFIAAGRSFAEGDNVSGGLYATGGVGGVMTALAAGGVWGGPVAWAGLALIGISVAGLMLWNNHKEVTAHEFDNDGGASARFLQHAGQANGQGGLSEAAARALTDQSGDGHSVVPLLTRYAELKGLNLASPDHQKRFVDWINGMTPAQLAALRDNLHHTADDIEGDPSRFTPTAGDDRTAVPDIAARPWGTRSGDRAAGSVAQLEAQLAVLQITALRP